MLESIKKNKVGIVRMLLAALFACIGQLCWKLEELLGICKKRNMTLILSHVNEQPMKVMEKAGFIEKAGRENFCENIDKALERARTLDK